MRAFNSSKNQRIIDKGLDTFDMLSLCSAYIKLGHVIQS